MTDTDIKKDLKEIAEMMSVVGYLQKAATIIKAIDLINQQESKIDVLKEIIDDLEEKIEDLWDSVVSEE